MTWLKLLSIILKLVSWYVKTKQHWEVYNDGQRFEHLKQLERINGQVRRIAGTNEHYDGLSANEREAIRVSANLYRD